LGKKNIPFSQEIAAQKVSNLLKKSENELLLGKAHLRVFFEFPRENADVQFSLQKLDTRYPAWWTRCVHAVMNGAEG
jgi:hypothetical protein